MTSARRPPAWFWVVGVAFALWGAAGCYACLRQVWYGADAMGAASAYDRALHASLPGWYNVVYAVAVGAGLLGALALLARSGMARGLFAVSLAAVVVQFGWLFVATDIVAVKGAAATVPFPALIAGIAALQLWFARFATGRGWIGKLAVSRVDR